MQKHTLVTAGIIAALTLIPIGGVAAASATTAPEEVASSTSSPATPAPSRSTSTSPSGGQPGTPDQTDGSAVAPTASPGTPAPADTEPEASSSSNPATGPAADSTGVPSASPSAPSPTSSPSTSTYTTVLWQIVDGDWTKPQPYIGSVAGADLDLLDHLQKCGTQYQVDIYHGDPSPLWADGFLHYGHDGGYLAYELGYTPYETLTTDDCAVVVPPTEEPSSPPTTTPPVVTPVPTAPEPEPTKPATTSTVPPVSPTSSAPSPSEFTPSVKPDARIAGGVDLTPGPSDSRLAFTGSDDRSALHAGLVMLGIGLLIVVGGAIRRKRAGR